MTVVLDCNILVICLTSRSPYHFIYRALVEGQFNLAVTTDIIFEYHEIIDQKYGAETANAFIALLTELPNVDHITTYYHWELMKVDPDDNKYCDCAVASSSVYIVTEDRHFQVLAHIPFPPLSTISLEDFASLLKTDFSKQVSP